MKLYVSIGPNPRIVRFFLAEAGLKIDEVPVDLVGGENRQEAFLRINPAGQLPVLEIAPGQYLAEAPVICTYLGETLGGSELTGRTPQERAEVQMWLRRIHELYAQPVSAAFRYGPGIGLFASRMRCLPDAAPGMAALAHDGETWFDRQLAGRPWLNGRFFSLADIALYCFADFARLRAGLAFDPAHVEFIRWFDAVGQRPAAGL